MNNTLEQRYISATLKELPKDLHAEVRLELAASIADAVEGRIAQGEDHQTAQRQVLTELGDPAILAASYADRPRMLIGPRYYLTWLRLLKLLAAIIAPVVFVVVFASSLAGDSLISITVEALTTTITALLHVVFWVTAVFAVLERVGVEPGVQWSVDQLPEIRHDENADTDLVASLIFLVLVTGIILWDQTLGIFNINDATVHILNPGLWPLALTGLLILVALEAIFAVVLYTRRGWSVGLAVINTVLAILFLSWTITLLVRGELFSPEFINLATELTSSQTVHTLGTILGLGIVCIVGWDIADGWKKAHTHAQNRRIHQG